MITSMKTLPSVGKETTGPAATLINTQQRHHVAANHAYALQTPPAAGGEEKQARALNCTSYETTSPTYSYGKRRDNPS